MPDKRERFVALAEKRVMRAIKDLRLVGNLANRNNYSYSDQDVQKILAVLDQEMKLLKNRFSAGESKPVPLFKL